MKNRVDLVFGRKYLELAGPELEAWEREEAMATRAIANHNRGLSFAPALTQPDRGRRRERHFSQADDVEMDEAYELAGAVEQGD
jgi:hypothetical protein